MAKHVVVLCRLVRETAEITVEADSAVEAKAKALEIYEEDEDGALDADPLDWTADYDYAPEPATHYLLRPDGGFTFFCDIPDPIEED